VAEPAPVEAPATPAAPAPPAAPAGAEPAGPRAGPAPAKLDDASHLELPLRVQAQPARTTDRRPLYLGIGLVALALLFWWNRRRRERFEAEDRGAADDEDLHAAADEPKADAADPEDDKEKGP
jgi:hypothetical protein